MDQKSYVLDMLTAQSRVTQNDSPIKGPRAEVNRLSSQGIKVTRQGNKSSFDNLGIPRESIQKSAKPAVRVANMASIGERVQKTEVRPSRKQIEYTEPLKSGTAQPTWDNKRKAL